MDQKITDIVRSIDYFYLKLYSESSTDVPATLKDNGTSVSKFDLDTTAFCIEAIQEEFPNANIWIEEDQAILKNDVDEYTWIIDPLDGTASFLRGYPIWGIGVSVLKNNVPILSYFYGPACNQKYLSYENKIFINDKLLVAANSVVNKDTKTIFVSSRLHKKINFNEFVDYKVRNFGSTLYHLFMVVLGKAESCVIGSSYIWDLAAVFELSQKRGYVFVEYMTKRVVSINELLDYKTNKIDTILEFKKASTSY